MKLVERFSLSKTGNIPDCEDIIYFGSKFAAVIDGASTRTNRQFSGKTSGLVAAEITRDALANLGDSSTLREILDTVTAKFVEFYTNHDIDPRDHSQIIAASAIIYSKFHKQIWMIGDCQCLVDGILYVNPNGIDDIIGGIRCFINQVEILKGKTTEWIMENDPGSKYISDLLVDQFLFQNLNPVREGTYNYFAFDGRYIETDNVRVIQLDNGSHEIVLASDGYPRLGLTLEVSEDMLSGVLEKDPLCIYENKSVKGLREGLVSFDDRAYLRFTVS